MNKDKLQTRSIESAFETREAEDGLFIEGYFSVFNTTYDMGCGMSESIAPGAFSNTLGNDIRALANHDTRLVLGRNKAGTLELKEDSHGLWGKIRINPNDSDAMNLYERVKRGDVSQCSFGFYPITEETDFRDDGTVHWTVKEVELHEVSVVTFPAYEDTGVSARHAEYEEIKKRESEAWKAGMLKRIRKEAE